ncbi:MAG: DNA-directed RNA polymerase subunit D [archaeon]
MQIKLLDQNEEKARLMITGSNPAYMNLIRREIVNKVPTMAIQTITFTDNSSAMYDEMLAHRLGLVVLTTDLKSYNLPSECKCKDAGCAMCELKITMDVEGPKNVYAEDLKSTDPNIKPFHPKTLLVKLLKGQNLKFEATARLGYGKDHVRHSAGLVFYQGYPNFKIGQLASPKKVVAVCPQKILIESAGKVKVTDETKCNLCMACHDEDHNIVVESDNSKFIMTVEPWGQFSKKDMLIAAIDVFDQQLKELSNELKKVK